jgi:thiamine biosynthesis lipoprotein
MGMPITVEIVDAHATNDAIEMVFDYFKYVDGKFSTYKNESEIMKINRGEISFEKYSADMKEIFILAEKTKKETDNYFDIRRKDGLIDPSGLVKGWAIHKACNLLKEKGFKNFCIEAGGDIETYGLNNEGKSWTVGIRNPFKQEEVVKILKSKNNGIATSGTYIRGQHIYNPKDYSNELNDIVSMTVIGPNIYEADRFATASFAMGKDGIMFIENLPKFEGYMIDKGGIATMTSGFEQYIN